MSVKRRILVLIVGLFVSMTVVSPSAPTALGKGSRYLKDMDRDSIVDSVSEYNYGDIQSHAIYVYHRFDQPEERCASGGDEAAYRLRRRIEI